MKATELASIAFKFRDASEIKERAAKRKAANKVKGDATASPQAKAEAEAILADLRFADDEAYAPELIPSKQSGICPFCGNPIAKGDPVLKLKLGDGFTDWPELLSNLDCACEHCAPWFSKDNMPQVQRVVISKNSITRLPTREALVDALLNPPEPPFVFIRNPAGPPACYHLIWKTPVTHSLERIFLNAGSILTLSHSRVVAATEAYRKIIAKHPKWFKGVIPSDELIAEAGIDRSIFANLSEGEIWAIDWIRGELFEQAKQQSKKKKK